MVTTIALLILATVLIVFNLKAISKEQGSFKGVLNNAENNMEEFQVEIGKLRREFAETLLEVQTQLVDLEEKIENSNYNINIKKDDILKNENAKDTNAYQEIVKYNDKINDVVDIDFNNTKKSEKSATKIEMDDAKESLNNNIKVKEIQKMLDEGLSIEEISNNLKIGKGEVLLIKELYLK